MGAAITPIDWTGGPALAVGARARRCSTGLGGAEPAPPGAERRSLAHRRFRSAGCCAILVALDSPLDGLADRAFWAHMSQHLLLIAVAPPLLALARPWNRMWHGLPARSCAGRRRSELVAAARWAPLRRAARFVGEAARPRGFSSTSRSCAWHLPASTTRASTPEPVHALEHLTFFATALLFWTRVIDSPPWRSPLSEPGKLAYLASTLVVGWILAIVLALATSRCTPPTRTEASRAGADLGAHRPAAGRRGDVGARIPRLHDRDRPDRLPFAGAAPSAARWQIPKAFPDRSWMRCN